MKRPPKTTPATTGMTKTSATVVELTCERKVSIVALKTSDR